MRIVFVLSLICVFQSFALDSYTQTARISISSENLQLEKILLEIENQTMYRFAYNKSELDLDKNYSISFRNSDIQDVLSKLFEDTDVDYTIRGRQIVLSSFSEAQQQGKTVSGGVTDSSGAPLPGVAVVIKGTTTGTVTDFDGNFLVTNVPSDATLVFSFIGLKTQEVNVASQNSFNVVMEIDAIGLDEVVAIGYGVKARRDLTGAVESIDSDEISKRAVSNISELLRGRISGLNTTISTSADGGSSILIRGKTSLKANNSPLIILDGMIFTGSLADINPLDIESVDVLKDASSAAVYGARSASGVIIITTKKGEKGEPIINVSMGIGISHLKDIQELKSPDEYINFRTDYFEGATTRPNGYFRPSNNLPGGVSASDWRAMGGEPSSFSDNQVWFNRLQMSDVELKNFEAGNSIDWFDEIFQTGLRQDYSASISGASDKSSHFFSLNYINNDGFQVGEKYENIRTRFNLETKVADFITVGVNGQFSHSDKSPSFDNNTTSLDNNGNIPTFIADLNQARVTSPYGDKYLEDGVTLKLYPHNDQAASNPFYYFNTDRNYNNDKLLGNIFAEIKLPFGFKYRVNWINDIKWSNNYYFSFSTPEKQGSGGARYDTKSYTWNIDQILTWEKEFGENHKVDATFLFNAESNNSLRSYASNSIFIPSETLGLHQLSFGTNPVVKNEDTEYKADAMLARFNYTLMDKYLFTFSIRQDGFSAFGLNNRRAQFPSGAFAWRVSEEDFFNVSWINSLKFRASWGVNGNRDIPLYQAVAALSGVEYIYNDNGSVEPVSGYTSSRMSNADLRWEKTEAINTGFDFSVLNGKLSGTIEGYKMSTTDLILDRSLPNVTGYSKILSNLGEIQNKGIELTLRSRLINGADFSWNSQLVFSMNKNKIKSLYGDMIDVLDENGNVTGQKEANDFANDWYIGEDIDRIYDFEIDGVYQVGEESEADKYGLAVGSFRIKDQNDDGEIVSRVDEKFLGYKTPRQRINWTNDLAYRNFEFSVVLDAQLGHSDSFDGHFGGGLTPDNAWEAPRLNGYSYPYWTPENKLNDWAKVGSINPYGASYYDSRSFLRIQNVSLSYNVPNSFLQAYKMKALKLSLDLSNLAVFHKWNNWDPETKRPTPMIGTFRLLLTL